MRSRVPTTRKPKRLWSSTLATFSGKIPACSVQTPSRSDASTSAAIREDPIFLPLSRSATYTLTSATPAYTQRLETALSAAQPKTSLGVGLGRAESDAPARVSATNRRSEERRVG